MNKFVQILLGVIEGLIEGGLKVLGIRVKAEGTFEDSTCKFTLTDEKLQPAID